LQGCQLEPLRKSPGRNEPSQKGKASYQFVLYPNNSILKPTDRNQTVGFYSPFTTSFSSSFHSCILCERSFFPLPGLFSFEVAAKCGQGEKSTGRIGLGNRSNVVPQFIVAVMAGGMWRACWVWGY
jgi:hypothetical protein